MAKNLISRLSNKNFWLLSVAVFLFIRIPTFLFPYDSDHWIFYYVGRKWLDGDILYLQVWDHKSPLIFALNGAMHAVFGESIILHRIFLGLVAAVTLLVFYITAKRFFEYIERKDPKLDSRIATLFFAFWGSLSQFTNSGNNTENFGVLALILAYYYYLRWKKSSSWKWLLYSGVAVSCLVFLKINFGILLIPLVIDLWMSLKKQTKSLLSAIGIWLVPTAVQAVVWLSYFLPRGLIDELLIAMIGFNGKYLRAGWAGNLSGQLIFIAILAVGFMSFMGAYFKLLKSRRTESPLLVLVGVSGLLFSGILGPFYSHYYLIVIPLLCLVASAYWREMLKNRLWIGLFAIGALLSFGISEKQLYNRFFGDVSLEAKQLSAAANYVQENTSPSDKIIFYGYGATFYRLTGRDSGSRYISASHPLIDEREGFGYSFTEKYIGDMSESRPKYVVVDLSTIHIYKQNLKVMNYFSRHYKIDITMDGYEIWKIK